MVRLAPPRIHIKPFKAHWCSISFIVVFAVYVFVCVEINKSKIVFSGALAWRHSFTRSKCTLSTIFMWTPRPIFLKYKSGCYANQFQSDPYPVLGFILLCCCDLRLMNGPDPLCLIQSLNTTESHKHNEWCDQSLGSSCLRMHAVIHFLLPINVSLLCELLHAFPPENHPPLILSLPWSVLVPSFHFPSPPHFWIHSLLFHDSQPVPFCFTQQSVCAHNYFNHPRVWNNVNAF